MASSHTTATTPASGASPKLSWIERFIQLTDGAQSPELFRRWAALAIISGALERKVWVRLGRRTLYPNMYMLLVGGPGIGKTDALREVIGFWQHVPDLKVAPSSVSRASLADELAKAERVIIRPGEDPGFVKFNSLQVAATEFGTFLTAYEGDFMSTLNDLFDNIKYKESKRHMKEPLDIPNPQLSIIAGTTPAWLGGTLPETAWAEGFSSRLLMVYSGEKRKVDLFAEDNKDLTLENELIAELKSIHALYGQFKFEDDMVAAFQEWYAADGPPIPDHPKLEHYLPRRPVHLLKMCMAFAAQRCDYLITLENYREALDLLIETESFMPDVFKAIRSSSDANTVDDAFAYIYTVFTKEGPVSEHRIIHFLNQRMPLHSVKNALEMMLSSGMLVIDSMTGGLGGRPCYRPTPRATHGR